MVYIFFVQPGDMMTFDNEISIMQSVKDLKEKVQQKCGIPLDQQVLLINGGEPLDPNKNLCSYMAGTDTNPIYLFSTNFDFNKIEKQTTLNFDDSELRRRLRDCCDLPASLDTVKKRAQLAQDYYEIAKHQLSFCEGLVHDQHMQQQGWSAVIANLEDIISEFRKRWDLFVKVYNEFIVDRDTYAVILRNFQDDKKVLNRIPVLPILLDTQKQNAAALQSSKTSEENTNVSSQETEPSKEISLFEYISSSADTKNTLDDYHDICLNNLERYENELMPSLKNHVLDTLNEAERIDKKEIEGLGKRLYDLDQQIQKIKKYVQQQWDMAQSFLQNQQRASNLRDKSILPDLCATHQQQLNYIGEYHKKLMDDRTKIIKAKYELCKSLCTRLSWVQHVENRIWELDQGLVCYHEQLNRLRKLLEIFQQVHLAPVTYMSAVAEVVRRRTFSQSFLSWASDIACHQLAIHNDEITRRKEFAAMFEGHFLTALFPGMTDVPPSFATEAPSMFDAQLPKVTEEDIEKLRKEVPDLADSLTMPDSTSALNFFKSTSKQEKYKADDTKAVEEKLIQAVSDVGLASNLDKNLLRATGSETCLATTAHGVPHLKDLDKGCESETDTEEFEKVGQSPLELNFEKDIPIQPQPEKQDASTSTEVGERSPLPPKKPLRAFQKNVPHTAVPPQSCSIDDPYSSLLLQRTVSTSNAESFANIKNISLDSIDELSSLKNFSSTNTDSCFASHYQGCTASLMLRSSSKSVSPQSPADYPSSSPLTGHQPSSSNLAGDFDNDEFYIDESLPSSISVETGNSQGDFVKQLDTVNNVIALLQDNLQISKTEHDKLRSYFVNMGFLARQAVTQLRLELGEVKTQVLSEKNNFSQHCESLSSSWENVLLAFDSQEKEATENLKREHELEISCWKKLEVEKNSEIERLQEEKNSLENEIVKSCEDLSTLQKTFDKVRDESTKEVEDLRKELENAELMKEKIIKDLTEKLKHEHKAEIDNIKSRFRLMTMERSPSNSSLEKEKSGDFSSLPSHATFLVQMQENFQMDKQKAVEVALSSEREKYQRIMSERIADLEARFAEERELLTQEIAKRVSEDKDKQIDLLREREKNLSLECIKHKTTIQQLTEYENESRSSELMDQIDVLRRENESLQEELEKFKSERVGELAVSVAVCEGRVDATTSPVRQRHDMTRSEINTSSSGTSAVINIDSCKVGDFVLILWDPVHESFKIFQESKHMYFLHSDFLEGLGLHIVDGTPNKTHCRGEVVDKEYCHARKSENRYKVPKGTKFFRVKVKPVQSSISSKEAPKMSSSQVHPHMSKSQTVSSSCETVTEEPSVSHSLPSSPTRLEVTIEETIVEVSEKPISPTRLEVTVEEPVIVSGISENKEESVVKNFAEDSGIVESVEQATVALEEQAEAEEFRNKNDNDRSSIS